MLHTVVAVMLAEQPPPEQRAALDRAITATYRAAGITNDPTTWTRTPPLLADLATTLTATDDPATQALAARLHPWTHGSFAGLFNGPTTTHTPASNARNDPADPSSDRSSTG